MKLQKAISLNDDMIPDLPAIISIAVVASAWAILVMDLPNSIDIAVTMVATVMCLLMAYIPLNHIFSKSLFEEEAYRYMVMPVSFQVWVIAKVYSGAKSCTASIWTLILCADFYMKFVFNSGGLSYESFFVSSAVAIINAHAALSDGVMMTNSVVFIIAASILAAMIESAFISAMILNGVIIYNLFDPRREKPQVVIGIAIVGILLYLAANLLYIWAPGLFFKNDLAIPQLIIAAGLKLGTIYGLARGAAHLLEKKYSLN